MNELERNENGLKRVYEDYLESLIVCGFKLVSETQAWYLVGDYCVVNEIETRDFIDWLKLSLPQWVKEHQDTTVEEFIWFLDDQADEMQEIDELIEEII